MSANSEKTNGIMGFVVSILLHGIFFAGCVAIDFGIHHDSTTPDTGKTEITKVSNHMEMPKAKS